MGIDKDYSYPRAMLTVSKTSTPHQFQISVSRVYEEDEANILDEDEEGAILNLSFRWILE